MYNGVLKDGGKMKHKIIKAIGTFFGVGITTSLITVVLCLLVNRIWNNCYDFNHIVFLSLGCGVGNGIMTIIRTEIQK